MMLPDLRERVCEANLDLPRYGLVTWTSGNVSARDVGKRLVVIKPSGMRYEGMTPSDMVVVDPDGRIVEGDRGPSSDTASHLGIYRRRTEVMSITHTHSTFATAWAATGRPIPCSLTAIADEFGGPIPCGGYAPIGGEAVGEEICRMIGSCPAILLKHHGVFTLGNTIEAAVKAAVMVEDVARTMTYALLIGPVESLPQEAIDENHERYQHRYGTFEASAGRST